MTDARTVTLETRLDAPADRVWEEVERPRLLLFVSAPMVRFTPVAPTVLPERWDDGPHVVDMRFYGLLPLGRQTIDISRPPARRGVRQLRDAGHGPSIRRWDHWITVEPDGDGTLYRDAVTIEAGRRTAAVAAFAWAFYAHRQRRWQALVRAGFDYGKAGGAR